MINIIADFIKVHMPKKSLGRVVFYSLFHTSLFFIIFLLFNIAVQMRDSNPHNIGGILAFFLTYPMSWFVYAVLYKRMFGKKQIQTFVLGGVLGWIVGLLFTAKYGGSVFEWSVISKIGDLFISGNITVYIVLHNAIFAILVSIGVFAMSLLGQLIFDYKMDLKPALKTIIIFSFLALSANVRAYEVYTHETILTKEAVDLLENINPYLEILNNKINLVNGNHSEDFDPSSITQGPRHFYRPTDQIGLWGTFQSALERLMINQFYSSAITKYSYNDKIGAYKDLGHVLHLAGQDMFCPPHVFGDAHAFKAYGDSYEEWVENMDTNIPAKWKGDYSLVTTLAGTPQEILNSSSRNGVIHNNIELS